MLSIAKSIKTATFYLVDLSLAHSCDKLKNKRRSLGLAILSNDRGVNGQQLVISPRR